MTATQALSLFFYIKTNFMLQVYYVVEFPKLQVIAVENSNLSANYGKALKAGSNHDP